MVETSLQHQIRRIQFLLILAVSLLSGLVLGREFGHGTFYAISSFVGLGLIMLLISNIQSSSSE